MLKTLSDGYKSLGHPICIGFDPDLSNLHPFLESEYRSMTPEEFIFLWYSNVVKATGDLAYAIKFQSAFFEATGTYGLTLLRDAVADAKSRGLYAILDAKRGDISSTMRAYGNASFEKIGADAMTILPWMGIDVLTALEPWLKDGKGVYTVWLSSNLNGRVIQDPQNHSERSAAKILLKIWEDWVSANNFQNQIGYVLGATNIPNWIENSLATRQHSLLMPGLGAQGGTMTKQLRNLIDRHPSSLLPISRGILTVTADTKLSNWNDYKSYVRTRFSEFIKTWKLLD